MNETRLQLVKECVLIISFILVVDIFSVILSLCNIEICLSVLNMDLREFDGKMQEF